MQESEATPTSPIANDPRLVAAVTNALSEQLDRRIKEREDRLLKILGALSALVLFLGYAGIKELINAAATNAVEVAFSRKTSDLEVPLHLATLATYIAKAKNEGSFSHTERADMMASLERLADLRRNGIEIGKAQFFSTSLEGVIETMSASDNNLYVDKIFDLFPDDCLGISSVVQTLVQHYGRQMVAEVGEIRLEARKRFVRAERAASMHNVQEFALIHRALAEFREADFKRSGSTDEALARISALPAEDQVMAWRFLHQYATGSWVKKKSAESELMRSAAIKLIEVYRDAPELENFSRYNPG